MMAIGPHQHRRFSRICTVPAHSFDWSAREWGVREQRRVIKGSRIWIEASTRNERVGSKIRE